MNIEYDLIAPTPLMAQILNYLTETVQQEGGTINYIGGPVTFSGFRLPFYLFMCLITATPAKRSAFHLSVSGVSQSTLENSAFSASHLAERFGNKHIELSARVTAAM